MSGVLLYVKKKYFQCAVCNQSLSILKRLMMAFYKRRNMSHCIILYCFSNTFVMDCPFFPFYVIQ